MSPGSAYKPGSTVTEASEITHDDTTTPFPPVVARDTWTAQVNELRVRETTHTCEGRGDVNRGTTASTSLTAGP